MKAEFRIKQIADDAFVIQRKFIDKKVKGSFWWKETIIREVWESVSYKGDRRVHSNIFLLRPPLRTFKTLKKAKKWIDDYYKYPITHNVD